MTTHVIRPTVARVVAAVALALLAAPTAAQTPAPTQGKPHVFVDLNSAAITSVLPFDERFVLVGKPGDRLQTLDVWYDFVARLTRERCDALVKAPALLDRNDPAYEPPVQPLLPDSANARWTRRATPVDSFWLEIGALAANEDYAFCFRTLSSLTASDSTTFVRDATTALNEAVRTWIAAHATATSFSAEALRGFQQTLRAALKTDRPLRIPEKSILAPSPDAAVISARFVALATPLVTRRRAIENVCAQRQIRAPGSPDPVCFPPEGSGEMPEQLRRDTTLATALQWMSRQRALPALARRAVDAEGDGAQWLRATGALLLALADPLPEGRIAEIALGRLPITTPRAATPGVVNLGAVLDTAPVASWGRNLDSTIARLSDVHALVVWAQERQSRKVAPGPAGDCRAPDPAYRRPAAERPSPAELCTLLVVVDKAQRQAVRQRENVTQLAERITTFQRAVAGLMTDVVAFDLAGVLILGSSYADYETRARWYIGQDLGVLYAARRGDVRAVTPYVGANIYFRPVNRRARVGIACAVTLRCISATIGVTTNDVSEDDRYSGVLGGKAIVLGVGTRVFDFFRVAYVSPLVYARTDASSGRRLRALYGASASIDADLKEVIGALGKALFP
jgi:hypothetical protein